MQHPIQLKDGRILFSTWQDVGTKIDIGDFQYASTPLFTIHPDGSNLQQFTEPHDHHKNVEHFISQLSDERVENVTDVVKEGDMVKVKVLEVDKQGRIRLSMKAVTEDD